MADLPEFPFPEGLKLHHATKAKFLALRGMLASEYPALSVEPVFHTTDDGSDVVTVSRWRYLHIDAGKLEDGDGSDTCFDTSEKLWGLAELLERCEELGLDPEATPDEADDEPQLSGSVVKHVYRERYREASTTGTSCGDWLAEWLATHTLDADGKLVVEAFVSILINNGVSLSAPWATARLRGSKGWQGRFRMNGRQVLEKVAALNGSVVDPSGNTAVLPAEFLVVLEARHAKWLKKERAKDLTPEHTEAA